MELDISVTAFTRDTVLLVASLLLLIGLVLLVNMLAIRGRGFSKKYFTKRWQEIVDLLADRKTWTQAVTDADNLVDEVLKRRGFKGKTMGERMISASKVFSNQDKLWLAHKLRNKIVHEHGFRAKKTDIHSALAGYRQALKDLRVL